MVDNYVLSNAFHTKKSKILCDKKSSILEWFWQEKGVENNVTGLTT